MSEINYKYNEDEILREVAEYIDGTYSQHYAANQIEASEFIMDAGHGEGFFIGNILKYAQRYGKKGKKEDARKDLMKVIHYALMAIYNHDADASANYANQYLNLLEKKENDELVYGKQRPYHFHHRVNYDDDYPNY